MGFEGQIVKAIARAAAPEIKGALHAVEDYAVEHARSLMDTVREAFRYPTGTHGSLVVKPLEGGGRTAEFTKGELAGTFAIEQDGRIIAQGTNGKLVEGSLHPPGPTLLGHKISDPYPIGVPRH